jgi:hypothetical protein
MIAIAMLLALQSLLQDDGSPYDPPKRPALKKHDHVQIQFPEPAKAPGAKDARPRWDRELRQWIRFEGKDTLAAVTVTAEVVDVRPNGTLVLQAVKRRTVNGVEELLRLTGEVSAANVTMNRTSAESLLNLSVVYDGPTSDVGPAPECRDVRLPAELLS